MNPFIDVRRGTFILVALLLTIGSSVQSRAAYPLIAWKCYPSSCLVFAVIGGFSSSGIRITGTWEGAGNKLYFRSAQTTITSEGCSSTSITSKAYTTSAPVLDDGVLADSVAKQTVQLLETQYIQYYSGSSSFTSPSPAVPCQ
jgi:hypothetical protein